MVRYKVIWTKPARKDLTEIVKYIAEVALARAAAKNLREKIILEGNALTVSPHYSVIDEKRGYYRKLITKNYFILFTINEEKRIVRIIQVLDARRDWFKLIR